VVGVIFRETALEGAFVVELERIEDDRGFFAHTFCRREFREHGLDAEVVQANTSCNRRRGTLRVMHYQAAPYDEAKLVRCARGAIYDVIVDLRPPSATFRRWVSVELSDDNDTMLFVPAGFAHGFQTLADDTEISYLMTAYYEPSAGRGVRWDDPAFEIEWPEVEARTINERDRTDFNPASSSA